MLLRALAFLFEFCRICLLFDARRASVLLDHGVSINQGVHHVCGNLKEKVQNSHLINRITSCVMTGELLKGTGKSGRLQARNDVVGGQSNRAKADRAAQNECTGVQEDRSTLCLEHLLGPVTCKFDGANRGWHCQTHAPEAVG